MRPCPKCGEARQQRLLELGMSIGCGGCGHIFERAIPVRPGARVVVRGTSGGRPVRPGQCR